MENLRKVLSDEEKFLKIFDKLDNEGSGYLNFVQVTNLLEKFKDGMYKDTVQNSKKKIFFNSKLFQCYILIIKYLTVLSKSLLKTMQLKNLKLTKKSLYFIYHYSLTKLNRQYLLIKCVNT
jgi:hypothetical protein